MKTKRTEIIRAATTDLSIDFCRDVMIKMREKGYEMVALSSPGDYLTKLNKEDGFKTLEVPIERRISLWSDFKSLFNLIRVFRKEKPSDSFLPEGDITVQYIQDITARILGSLCAERNCAKVLIL